MTKKRLVALKMRGREQFYKEVSRTFFMPTDDLESEHWQRSRTGTKLYWKWQERNRWETVVCSVSAYCIFWDCLPCEALQVKLGFSWFGAGDSAKLSCHLISLL